MSDHIPDTGKMVPDKVVMLRTIAAMLDHPNVYMGGPSQRNMRRAEEILAAVAPLIAAQERERVATLVEALEACAKQTTTQMIHDQDTGFERHDVPTPEAKAARAALAAYREASR